MRRRAVDHVRQVHGLSQRRACGLIGMDVSSYRYRSRRGDDGPLRERLRALAGLRRRFGYRRLAWLLEREGMKVNLKKVYRLYREEGLAVKRRRGRYKAEGELPGSRCAQFTAMGVTMEEREKADHGCNRRGGNRQGQRNGYADKDHRGENDRLDEGQGHTGNGSGKADSHGADKG